MRLWLKSTHWVGCGGGTFLPTLERQRPRLGEVDLWTFQASLADVVNSRPDRATQWEKNIRGRERARDTETDRRTERGARLHTGTF